jgi:hypothetical protein
MDSSRLDKLEAKIDAAIKNQEDLKIIKSNQQTVSES